MKKQNLLIIGSLAALAAFPLGCSGGGDSSDSGSSTTPTTTTGTTGAAPTAGGPPMMGGGRPGMMGGPPGMPGAYPGMMGGTPGAATPAGGVAGAAGKAGPTKRSVPPIKVVKDPFYISWKKAPLPPYVFNEVEPLRLASADVKAPPPQDTVVREVPTRRVSGIMSGEGIYAILESGGDNVEIVKPGSKTYDGYKVVSITADSVKLERRDGNYIYTQIVPLTDVPVGAQTASYGGQRPGMGGVPGGFPGAPGGRPGFGGGGGGKRGED